MVHASDVRSCGDKCQLCFEKRTTAKYVKERVKRLVIPLISGLLLLVPIMTYFAERFHNGYTGGYLEQYILFFTKKSDLSRYTGGFTVGHLWFILYLFIISMLTLPLILWYNKYGHKLQAEKIKVPMLLPMFFLTSALSLILNIGGKSLGYYFAFFSLGCFVLAEESIQARLEKNAWPLFAGFAVMTGTEIVFWEIWGYNVLFLHGWGPISQRGWVFWRF